MSSPPTVSQRIDRLLTHACDICAGIGGLILIAIASMTVVSVVGRAFFSSPILGDVELVQLGCAVVVSCFLPYAQFRRANLIVDFFTANASASAQRWMDLLGTLLYTSVLILVCWRVAAGGVAIHEAQEKSMLMALPLWIPYVLMLPGLVLCSFIGLFQSVQLLWVPEGEAV